MEKPSKIKNIFNSAEFIKVINKIFDREKENAKYKESSSLTFGNFLKPPDYPHLVQIGISAICNLQCPECYYRIYSKKIRYNPVLMDFCIFKKVIDEMKNFPSDTVLRFLGRGESLIHPQLEEMTSYAKSKLSGPIALITNGQLLSDDRIKSLLMTKIDVVDVSMDALTAKTYSKVRSGDYNNLVRNVEKLIYFRNIGKYPTKIMVSFLIQPENYFEVEDFRRMWNKKVDKVIFRKYHTYGGKIPEKFCVPEQRYPCAALWNRININESGKITLCYIDWDESTVLADLRNKETSIIETWKKAYNSFRKQHLEEKYPKLCANCKTGWQAAHWQLSYEKAIADVLNQK